MKKRTAVFSFKKRTKYGKNVLVGSSALLTLQNLKILTAMNTPLGPFALSIQPWFGKTKGEQI